tara:strand:- start:1407 stop:2603 length:1197 start_codon:yes stop_codon:yes gene_type:complete
MKNKLFLFLTLFLTSAVVFGQNKEVLTKKFIASIGKEVNDYRQENPWKEKDDNWIRGTYYTGVMSMYHATGDKGYLNQSEAFCKSINWTLPSKLGYEGASGANLLTCGQTMLECYMAEKENYKIINVLTHLENPEILNPVSSPLKWYYESGMRYVDGIFTGPPTLAMLYKITGDDKYLQWMDTMVWDIYGALYDNEEGLFYRDIKFKSGYSGKVPESWIRPDSIKFQDARRSYVYQKTTNGKKVIWSRGNGWAIAGLARILKYLPVKHASFERYKAVFIKMAEELKLRQQENGFWYPNLEDDKDFGYKESSGTGFFTYGLAWGVNNGILSQEEYIPVIQKSWEALVSTVDEKGKVKWGQLVGGSPYKILEEDSHEYVSGIFLLAASEMYKLNQQDIIY